MTTREELLAHLADLIVGIDRPHPIRVGIDGVDGAGKTIMADELVPYVEGRGRPTIRASIDAFQRPRAERYRLGPDSPEGYYLDSFDHETLRAVLLAPLGPAGHRRYRRAVFDWRSVTPVVDVEREAPVDAVLLIDGVFLGRPELVECWDLHVFLDVDFPETVRRATARDQANGGSADDVRRRYATRYVPGQRLYLASARPREHAHLVIDNTDPAHPRIRRDYQIG